MAKSEELSNLDWIQIRSGDEFHQETGTEKLVRKMKENPFVPIGALMTTACLSYGLVSFRRGERKMSQMMMRARVVAQGFTVVALAAGIFMTAAKQK